MAPPRPGACADPACPRGLGATLRLAPAGKHPCGWARACGTAAAPGLLRRRLVRGGDIQSLPPEVRAGAQRAWTGENGHGQRSAVEFTMGAPRETLGGHASARRPGPVAREIAGKATVHRAGCP